MIVLVDSKSAEINYLFIYLGESEECGSCKMRIPCHSSLEKGRRYIVTGLKNKNHPCRLFGGVSVCEVEESQISAAINGRWGIPGATIRYHQVECKEILCKNAEICMPEGLLEDDRCIVENIKGKLQCSFRDDYVVVSLKRI